MKKKSLILFICWQTLAFSQKYQSVDSTTVWVANQVYKVCTNCYLNRDIKYYSSGYELNNSRIWNKLYYNEVTSFAFCTTCTMTPLPINNNKLLGYYTNDTITKKVYLYSSLTLPPNYNPVACDILYDFNKIIGDTMEIKAPCFPSWQFKINSIDSILFSGKYYKRFLTTCIQAVPPINSQKIAFTEGIGSSLGPFEPMLDVMGENYSFLKCFSSPTQTLTVTNYTLFGSGSCSNLAMSVNNTIEKQNSILYPNPNNGTFKLKIDQEIKNGELVLFNSLGQKVHEQKIIKGENNIIMKELSEGLYNYIILQDNIKIKNGKIAIE